MGLSLGLYKNLILQIAALQDATKPTYDMKKLILLLFIPLVFTCSSDSSDSISDDNGSSNNISSTITFRVQEVWDRNTNWFNDTHTVEQNNNINCNDDEDYFIIRPEDISSSDLTGFETFWEAGHRSIDTLFIELFSNSSISNPQFFDFNLTSRIDLQSHPNRIGHIEFIGFEDNDKIRLDENRMNDWSGNVPMIYFTSNKSEEFIDNITMGDFICTPFNAFDKSTYTGYYLESTEINITVPFDELNNNLEINDTIRHSSLDDGYKPLGEGWGATFNANHKIVAKTVNN
jgi:hypothetical protein